MRLTISRRAALTLLGGACAATTIPRAFAADKLRVGKAVIEVFGYIPLDVGMKYGIFAKHGIEIEEVNFAGGPKLAQAITAGSVDIGLSSGPAMAYTAKGAPEIAIATITASPAFMGLNVGKNFAGRTVDDLKGKKIGVVGAGSLTAWLVAELNRVKGWGESAAVPVSIGGEPTAELAAIKTGAVDATLGGVAEGYKYEEKGDGRLLAPVSVYVKELELFTMFASNAIIQEKPDVVRRFLTAWFETVAYMKTHKAETIEVTSSVIPGYTKGVSTRLYDGLMTQFSMNGRFTPGSLDKLRASFIDLKVLDPSADMSKLYTEAFLPKT
ncbi:MAG TPA: ABC transporter substrate-binding protein [Stellaceae bacterium]|nr:ABC transporter substrate-binding protein [Stellaceae bacterium]